MNQADMNQAGTNRADSNRDVRDDLSAGIDGELSKEELRFLLRRLDHDASLQQAWARYHVARDGLRRELPGLASADFSGRVMLAIEQQAVPAATRRGHWLRWSAGGAIAASVAAVALMVGQPAGDADHGAISGAHHAMASANTAPVAKSSMPATVPPWLSGNSAGLLSQQASATLGAPLDANPSNYARGLSTFPPMHRYRTLDNKDGSYLLLLGPQPATPDGARQAGAAAQ
ncbi:MAG TPA: RseA family anti-sigma factor [Rhodanobacter sp.]